MLDGSKRPEIAQNHSLVVLTKICSIDFAEKMSRLIIFHGKSGKFLLKLDD